MIQGLAQVLLREKDVKPSGKILENIVDEIAGSIHRVPITLHPLGFVHFDLTNLVDFDDDSFARFHIWDPSLAPPDEGGSIHDHTWELNSLVLKGNLRNRNYRPLPDKNGQFVATRVIYGHRNSFIPAGNYSLELVSDQTLREMDTYSIPSRLVHESTLLSSVAVTFVVGTPDGMAKTRGPLLLNSHTQYRSGTSHRKRLSDRHGITLLQEIV